MSQPAEPAAPVAREPLEAWLRFHLAPGAGPRTVARLRRHFGSLARAVEAPAAQLAQVPGIGQATAQRIADGRDRADVDAEIENARRLGVTILTLDHPDYPLPLRDLPDAPPVLYARGSLVPADRLAVAVVGSRQASHYGLEQAGRFASLLAGAGFTVVSGLARGVDAAAHRGALAADGRTLAVLGCGLARVYPPEHDQLADEVAARGALLSELPLTFMPLSNNFPARNRIIAGLSLATLVIEARPRSGALITARLALDYHREVLALPGRVDSPGAAGPHRLIRDGAALVTNVEDVLDALGPVGRILSEHAADTGREPSLFDGPDLLDALPANERDVLEHLTHEPLHVDQLVAATGQPVSIVHAALTSLQLKTLARQHRGGYYTRR